jgi:hypothetical protein
MERRTGIGIGVKDRTGVGIKEKKGKGIIEKNGKRYQREGE